MLGLPRGGVAVAFEVAVALGAPLDVVVVRKLGVPGHEELAMGALAAGECVLNDAVIGGLGISPVAVEAVIENERAEVIRRERLYRQNRPRQPLAGRTVLLVDDGLATGSTMQAAVRAVRRAQPAVVVVAVPTAPPEPRMLAALEADAVVCDCQPYPFQAVGLSYDDFRQTTDDEVRALLRRAAARADPGRAGRPAG